MSDDYQNRFSHVRISPRVAYKVVVFGLGLIVGMVAWCCRRLRRNTGSESSCPEPVVGQSNSNASPLSPIALPPPPTIRTNHQAPYIQPPQPASNTLSTTDASTLPPSYDQVCAKQPPYNQAAHQQRG